MRGVSSERLLGDFAPHFHWCQVCVYTTSIVSLLIGVPLTAIVWRKSRNTEILWLLVVTNLVSLNFLVIGVANTRYWTHGKMSEFTYNVTLMTLFQVSAAGIITDMLLCYRYLQAALQLVTTKFQTALKVVVGVLIFEYEAYNLIIYGWEINFLRHANNFEIYNFEARPQDEAYYRTSKGLFWNFFVFGFFCLAFALTSLAIIRRFIARDIYQRMFKSNDLQMIFHILMIFSKFATFAAWLVWNYRILDPNLPMRDRPQTFCDWIDEYAVMSLGGFLARLMLFYIVWCYVRVQIKLETPVKTRQSSFNTIVSSYYPTAESSVNECPSYS